MTPSSSPPPSTSACSNANMACPNNISPGNFLMDSLMGGSSSFRAEGFTSSPGMYLHAAAECGYSVMRNIGKVGPSSSLSKRDEASPGGVSLSGFQDAPYLSAQLAAWTPGSKSCRVQQPVAQCLQPCAFPAGSVKEEAFCCLYPDDSNKGRQTTESATYIRLGDNGCRAEPTPASSSSSGYFQVFGGDRPQQDEQQLPHGFSLTHLASPGDSAAATAASCRQAAQEAATEVSTPDESESRKEEKAKSDSCSDNSDGELKGRTCAPPLPPLPSFLPHPPSLTHVHAYSHVTVRKCATKHSLQPHQTCTCMRMKEVDMYVVAAVTRAWGQMVRLVFISF